MSATSPVAGPIPSRLGLRARITLVGTAGLVAALAVGTTTGVALDRAEARTADRGGLTELAEAVDDLRSSNADVTRWQTAYAWDARNMTPARAVAQDSPNRAGYLASAAGLRDTLAAMPVDVMDAGERTAYEEIAGLWEDFFVVDDRVAAQYARGTAADVDAADAAIVDDGYAVYGLILEHTAELGESVDERVEQARDEQSAAAARARLAALSLFVVALLVAGVTLHRVARRVLAGVGSVSRGLPAMARGALPVVLTVDDRDEVSVMAYELPADRWATGAVMSVRAGSAQALSAPAAETAEQADLVSAAA